MSDPTTKQIPMGAPSDEGLTLLVQTQGMTVRMSSPAKWRRAIELNDLNPETIVQIEAADGAPEAHRAGDLPSLWPLFESMGLRYLPLPDASDHSQIAAAVVGAPEEDEPQPQTEEQPVRHFPPVPETAADTPDVQTPIAERPPYVEAAPAKEPAPAPPALTQVKPRTNNGKWIWAVLAAAVLVWLASRGGGSDSLAPGETVYVSRPVNVRTAKSSRNNSPEAQLVRGDKLRGAWQLGDDGVTPWLLLTSGAHKDKFVWGRNLSQSARPKQKEIVERLLWTNGRQVLYAEPTTDAAALRTFNKAVQLCVGSLLETGWWEVLPDKGGVGYLPPGSLDPNVSYLPIPIRNSTSTCK